MKKNNLIIVSLVFIFNSCEIIPDGLSGASKPMATDGNSLFHQTESVSLQTGTLEVAGEVEEPGMINFDNHYKREVMIKESIRDEKTGTTFLGAFRYIGYSLFDILHPFNVNKKNAGEFRPQTDIYIIIENAQNESVVFSWSEIFHTNIPHQIMIASEVAPIVPYRAEVDYSIGEKWKVVAGNDLYAYRVLEDPVKITVRSFDHKKYEVTRNMEPLFSDNIHVLLHDEKIANIIPSENEPCKTRYFASFYGMGMGYHEAEYFEGPKLESKLSGIIQPFDQELNRHGLVCFAGADGYRAIYSYSELFNRTDQTRPILSIADNPMEGGYYRIFQPLEFYADRSVKALKEIYIFKP